MYSAESEFQNLWIKYVGLGWNSSPVLHLLNPSSVVKSLVSTFTSLSIYPLVDAMPITFCKRKALCLFCLGQKNSIIQKARNLAILGKLTLSWNLNILGGKNYVWDGVQWTHRKVSFTPLWRPCLKKAHPEGSAPMTCRSRSFCTGIAKTGRMCSCKQESQP